MSSRGTTCGSRFALVSSARAGPTRGRRLVLAGAALWLLTIRVVGGQTPSAGEASTPLLGRSVASVTTRCDGPIDSEEVGRLIEIRVGQPLTEEATGATIRNLFATGHFADVRIEAQPAQQGVDVIVHLDRAYRVKPLRFTGKLPLSREELRRVLPFAEGSVLLPSVVAEGGASLVRRLEAEGFLQARVEPEVTENHATFDARVVYRLIPGVRARVARPLFDGDTKPFAAEDLERRTHLKVGRPYDPAKASADAARMTKWLHKQSRLKATVELIVAQPTTDGRIVPVYRVSVGKKIVFETRGVKAATVRREINDLTEGEEFDEDLILQYVENKREQLQHKGFARARVEYTIAEAPDTTTVTVTVDQGPHLEIERVVFSGNTAVPSKTLQSLMVTHKKGFSFLQPGHLVDKDLDGDVAAIRGYYQTHGFLAVVVDKPRITEGSKPDRLVVTIPIEEKPRTVVASRTIVGAEHVDTAVLEKRVGVKIGHPYNPDQARQDAYDLTAYYHDHGWREASVRDEAVLSADKTTVAVTYRVDEGLHSFFGKTIVRGNTQTSLGSILRLVTWHEGEAYSETKVVETQRNLARAGVFAQVEIRPEPADPMTQIRNVDIELREGRPLSVLYGVGYQYAPDAEIDQKDPFAVAGVSYNNLFGKMLSAGLEGQLALSGRFRLQLSFRYPFLFNKDFPVTSYLFATREPIQDIDLERLGWVNEISHYFGRFLRVAYRVEYQRIRPFNPQDLSLIEAENFPQYDQPIEEATTGPNFFYDRRDDVLDPHHGYYATAAFKYAFPFWKAQARYTKATGQVAYFQPIGRNVLALSVRAGGIFPYGPSDIQVPIAERYFGGKNSTNRGFDTDLLGIPGQTVDYDTHATLHTGSGVGSCAASFPSLAAYDCNSGPRIIGGNGLLSLNGEFRFPIAGPVSGALFYDAAQVWENFSDVGFRFEGADGLRQSVGVGLRIILPIGPLRADFGVPVERRLIPYNVTDPNGNVLATGSVRERGRFFFSIGYPF